MRKITQFAAIALALSTSIATASGDLWMTDFAAAKKKAAAENKDLLVDFTGSDWCSWCIKLTDEVFKHDSFTKSASQNYVFVEIDFPQDKSKQSEALQKQNNSLQQSCSVQGFPTILLMDDQGRPYAKTGYQDGGPDKYIAHLKKLQENKTKRDAALADANKLSGEAKATALVTLLRSLPENYLNHYQGIIDDVAKLDPEDKTGFVSQQKLQLALTQLEAKLTEAMQSGKADSAPGIIDTFLKDHDVKGEDKKNLLITKLQLSIHIAMQKGETDSAIQMVDSFISEQKITGTEKQQVLGIKMGPYLNEQKFDDANKVLDAIIAIDPESAPAKQAKEFKPRIEEMKKEAAEAAKSPTKPAGKKNPAHGEPGHKHAE